MPATIAYFSPFVPAEWIDAHGLRPLRARPELSPSQSGTCPFTAASARETTAPGVADAVVFTTCCHQMRRAAEAVMFSAIRPTFLMTVPATWQGAAPRQLYTDELHRLSRFMISLGGVAPDAARLAAAMQRQQSARDALPRTEDTDGDGVRVALIGAPLTGPSRRVFDLVRDCGGRVVVDATETGPRCEPDRFDPAGMRRDPLNELIRAYFDHIPDAFRWPDTMLHEYLQARLTSAGAQAAVLLCCAWCDLWGSQVIRLGETLNLPLLRIELTGADGEIDRSRPRFQRLLESVR